MRAERWARLKIEGLRNEKKVVKIPSRSHLGMINVVENTLETESWNLNKDVKLSTQREEALTLFRMKNDDSGESHEPPSSKFKTFEKLKPCSGWNLFSLIRGCQVSFSLMWIYNRIRSRIISVGVVHTRTIFQLTLRKTRLFFTSTLHTKCAYVKWKKLNVNEKI